MEELEEKNKKLITIGIVLLCVILLCAGYYMYRVLFIRSEQPTPENPSEVPKVETTDYNMKIIKEINENEDKNYLISPYSIEMAFSMLRDGTDGRTREEIENLIGNREINMLKVPGKVNVANGVFINQKYKDDVLSSYYDIVKNKYKSEIIYDEFKTPITINNWVKKETYQMIPKLFDRLSQEDLLVLVNALAIDVEWKQGFDCKVTSQQEFTKKDGNKVDVAMMRKGYESDAKHFNTDDATGVIIPYASYDGNGNKVDNGNGLEFIGILPNGDVKDYVNNLTNDKINEFDKEAIVASEDEKLIVDLPKFNYEYEINDLIDSMKKLGIKKVFEAGADLSKMINIPSHVSEAVHKTYIEVDENGTKAAAASGIRVTNDAAVPVEVVTFDKPFAYIIRDQKAKEMLFFGVVYEPNKWEGSTCK